VVLQGDAGELDGGLRGAGAGEELGERQARCIGGGRTDAAGVAFGVGDEFFSKARAVPVKHTDADGKSGDEAGDQVEPENEFAEGHEGERVADAERRQQETADRSCGDERGAEWIFDLSEGEGINANRMADSFTADLGQRSYPIWFGADLVAEVQAQVAELKPSRPEGRGGHG